MMIPASVASGMRTSVPGQKRRANTSQQRERKIGVNENVREATRLLSEEDRSKQQESKDDVRRHRPDNVSRY